MAEMGDVVYNPLTETNAVVIGFVVAPVDHPDNFDRSWRVWGDEAKELRVMAEAPDARPLPPPTLHDLHNGG